MLEYDTIFTPTPARSTGVCRSFVIRPLIQGRRSARYLRRHLGIWSHRRLASLGACRVTARPYYAAEAVSFAISSRNSVWYRSVYASFFWHKYVDFSQFSQPAKCGAHAAAVPHPDYLPSEVPIRAAI